MPFAPRFHLKRPTQATSTTSFTGAFNAQQRAAVAASAGQALTLVKSLRVETVETLKVWI